MVCWNAFLSSSKGHGTLIINQLFWWLKLSGDLWKKCSVQSLSRVWLFVTPWITARQASLSITNCWSLPKPMSIESVMPSNHLILCCPLLLLPSIFPSIRVFSNELALHIRWPKYWSFSFNISPSNEYSGLISFRMDWLDLLAVQGTQESSPTPQLKSINSSVLSFLYSPTLTSIHDKWKKTPPPPQGKNVIWFMISTTKMENPWAGLCAVRMGDFCSVLLYILMPQMVPEQSTLYLFAAWINECDMGVSTLWFLIKGIWIQRRAIRHSPVKWLCSFVSDHAAGTGPEGGSWGGELRYLDT